MSARGAGPGGAPALQIQLFGEFRISRDGVPQAPLDSARAESLLAYLLLHRDVPQRRQRLAFLLWPDSTEAQAMTNLRHVLHNLRRSFPESDRCLAVTQRSLQWRADQPLGLDVAAFEAALARGEVTPAGDPVRRHDRRSRGPDHVGHDAVGADRRLRGGRGGQPGRGRGHRDGGARDRI